MGLYCAEGSIDTDLSSQNLSDLLTASLAKLGEGHNVLAVPPDQTRLHSGAGELTCCAWQYYGDRMTAVLPALGRNFPMGPAQITSMYGDMPAHLFLIGTGGRESINRSHYLI